jgi:hypothetical protein
MLVKVNATVSHPRPKSLNGAVARLWDADLIKDDLLAESRIDGGVAEFLFHLDQVHGVDSPLESFPDLYLTVVADDERLLFRSETVRNVDFSERLELSGQSQTTLDVRFEEKLGN